MKKSINRREFMKKAGAGIALTLPLLSIGCGSGRRPNILFIMSDDHAWQAISAYGSRINTTPNLDRLAAEGVRFNQSFCTNAICAPSRAVLLTGKYSHKNSVVNNSQVFDKTQTTFPKLLQQAGYETAMIGKWHLKSEPTGFDYWNILPGQGDYYNPDFIDMGARKQIEGYVTDIITDIGLDWLRNREGSRPFCMLLHHKAPHRNWLPPLRHLNLYKDEEMPVPDNFFDNYSTRSKAAREQEMEIDDHMMMTYDLKYVPEADWDNRAWQQLTRRMKPHERQAFKEAYGPRNQAFRTAKPQGRDLALWKYQHYIKDYLRCIKAVDENVGRVLDYLEKTGLKENTLVVYTSDQGFYLGEHGWFDKRFMYEESLRMPLIMRFPGEISPHVDTKSMVLNLDFAPTFLDYAHAAVPVDMQGKSLRSILKSSGRENFRKAVYYHYFEYPAVHAVKRHYGIRTPRYKLIHFYYDIDAWELYDLKKDPHEMNNVYDDPAYAQTVKKLKQELENQREKYGDTDIKKFLPQEPVRIKHIAAGSSVTLRFPFSAQYRGGGSNGLCDGLAAPENIRAPADYKLFQGFEGVDLDAVIDLKKPVMVHRVSAGFLQKVEDWIFMPLSVQLKVSLDGKKWIEAGRLKNTISAQKQGVMKYSFNFSEIKKDVRFLHIIAENRGICPEKQAGAGSKAWIFADEVVVE